MTPYRLRWFEEPCDPLDFATLAEISNAYPHALSTGENLFSQQDVENLVRFGNLKPARRDVIQVDPPQAYGSRSMRARLPHWKNSSGRARATFRMAATRCRSRSRRIQSRRRGKLSGRVRVFAGFADDARIENGYISLSDRPGIGFEGQAALYQRDARPRSVRTSMRSLYNPAVFHVNDIAQAMAIIMTPEGSTTADRGKTETPYMAEPDRRAIRHHGGLARARLRLRHRPHGVRS